MSITSAIWCRGLPRGCRWPLGQAGEDFYASVIPRGFPKSGYGQRLSACVWRYGDTTKAQRIVKLSNRRKQGSAMQRGAAGKLESSAAENVDIFPLRPNLPLTACQAGTASGIAAIIGDDEDTLAASPELQRCRVKQIATALPQTFGSSSLFRARFKV